jgi:hypothetical protein
MEKVNVRTYTYAQLDCKYDLKINVEDFRIHAAVQRWDYKNMHFHGYGL